MQYPMICLLFPNVARLKSMAFCSDADADADADVLQKPIHESKESHGRQATGF